MIIMTMMKYIDKPSFDEFEEIKEKHEVNEELITKYRKIVKKQKKVAKDDDEEEQELLLN